jgi:hypothetical protein
MSQGGWYWCNQCQGLYFADSVSVYNWPGFCPAGGVHNNAGSSEYGVPNSGAGQPGWKWCNQCMGLFFTGRGLGVCPSPFAEHPDAGSANSWHNPLGSGNYFLSVSEPEGLGFRWCSKCGNLFLTVAVKAPPPGGGPPRLPSLGVCGAGGAHDPTGSGSYDLRTSGAGQSDWFPCTKCLCLFFAGSRDSNLGLCAAGGAHEKWDNGNPNSNFVLSTSGAGQSGWKWCNKCQCLFFGDPIHDPNACVAHTHNDIGSGDYFLETSGGGQSDWRYCSKCQGLFFAGTPGSNLGVCPAGGNHTDSGSADYFLSPPALPTTPPTPPTPPAAATNITVTRIGSTNMFQVIGMGFEAWSGKSVLINADAGVTFPGGSESVQKPIKVGNQGTFIAQINADLACSNAGGSGSPLRIYVSLQGQPGNIGNIVTISCI